MSKILIVDLRKDHIKTAPENSMLLYELDSMMLYAKYAQSVHFFTNRLVSKIENYITACFMSDIPVILHMNNYVFHDNGAIVHIQSLKKDCCENMALAELLQKTWALIAKNSIPLKVVQHIDDYLPQDKLRMYDIELGCQCLPLVKMNTYKPTDLQRAKWGVEDKNFAFSHKPKLRYEYRITLYDKLLAWLALNFYLTNDFEPLYIPNEPVTPVSACDIEDQYKYNAMI